MPLCSANDGKYLMPRWHKMHAEAMVDRSRFTAEELEWLEISNDQGTGALNPESYRVENVPLDPLTEPKERDIRNDHDKA